MGCVCTSACVTEGLSAICDDSYFSYPFCVCVFFYCLFFPFTFVNVCMNLSPERTLF